MDAVTAKDWGALGAIEKTPGLALTERGQRRLEAIANRMLRVRPGRPNRHSDHTLRADRPKQEVLMPHGLEAWPAREPEPYLVECSEVTEGDAREWAGLPA